MYLLSPAIFNAYILKALDEVRENMEVNGGVKFPGEYIDMTHSADDIAIPA